MTKEEIEEAVAYFKKIQERKNSQLKNVGQSQISFLHKR